MTQHLIRWKAKHEEFVSGAVVPRNVLYQYQGERIDRGKNYHTDGWHGAATYYPK
jgi:hypothetical protein